MTARYKAVRARLVHAYGALRFVCRKLNSVSLRVIQLALALLRCYLTKAGSNTCISSKAWAITCKRLETLAQQRAQRIRSRGREVCERRRSHADRDL
jgi:hypothetical protein